MPFIACIRNTPPELSYIMAGLEYIDSSLQLLFHGMFDPILSLHLQFHKNYIVVIMEHRITAIFHTSVIPNDFNLIIYCRKTD